MKMTIKSGYKFGAMNENGFIVTKDVFSKAVEIFNKKCENGSMFCAFRHFDDDLRKDQTRLDIDYIAAIINNIEITEDSYKINVDSLDLRLGHELDIVFKHLKNRLSTNFVGNGIINKHTKEIEDFKLYRVDIIMKETNNEK